MISFKKLVSFFLISAYCLCPTIGFADELAANTLPAGYAAVHGQSSYSTSGAIGTLTATDAVTIGNWDSFSVGSQATFNANINGVHLSRVIGADPSQIFGNLNVQGGQFFLVNPSGILFGPGSQVNAPGLVASTLNMLDSDFIAGRYQFDALSPSTGLVANEGNISIAPGGSLALLGSAVRNDGNISAPGGSVVLAAGGSATLSIDNQGLIAVSVESPLESDVYDLQGNRVNEAISQSGSIQADNGIVVLTAQARGELLDSVINHSGTIQARHVSNEGGVIRLLGGNEGIVSVSGTLDASGQGAGHTGGTVHVLGDKVGLFSGAVVDVNGSLGGGSALIGGDFQGNNESIQNASRTFVGSDTLISADATQSGDGGTVIVWADEITRYYGNISARGGIALGDGGFVEVSGKQNLTFDGAVNLEALQGEFGTLLLDPDDATFQNAPGAHDGQLSAGDGNIAFADGTGIDFFISDEAIESVLGSIFVKAQDDIFINEALNLSNQTSGETVSFQAGESIHVDAAITTMGADLVLSANDPNATSPSGMGSVYVVSAITTNGGDFTSEGVDFDNTGGTITTGTGTVSVLHTGNIVIDAKISSGSTSTTTIETTGGNIDITGSEALTLTSGFLDISAVNGSINGNIAFPAAIKLTSAGISLTAKRIGSPGQTVGIHFTNGAGNQTFELDARGTLVTDDFFLEIFNNGFDGISISQESALFDIDIELPNADVIDINGGGGAVSLNNILLTSSSPTFDYTLSDTATLLVNLLNNASNTVDLAALDGAIEDGGTNPADILATDLTLVATEGIGHAAAMEIDVDTLTLAATDSGSIQLADVAGGMTVGLAIVDDGYITLSGAGGLTVLLAYATDGNITLSASSGDLTAYFIISEGVMLEDVSLSTSNSGDIYVGYLEAPDLVTIDSAESILDLDGDYLNVFSEDLTLETPNDVATALDPLEYDTTNPPNTTSVAGTAYLRACSSGDCVPIEDDGSVEDATESISTALASGFEDTSSSAGGIDESSLGLDEEGSSTEEEGSPAEEDESSEEDEEDAPAEGTTESTANAGESEDIENNSPAAEEVTVNAETFNPCAV